MSAARRLLVTGFGPFPRMPRNPSAGAAERLARSPRWRRLGVEPVCRILTTAYATLPDELDPALAGVDAVLMIGVAGRAARIRVEGRATGRRSVLFPDAAGHRATRPAQSAAPAARRTWASPAQLLLVLRHRGCAARISRDAGRYLCNAAYFRALAAPIPVVFIHIPKPGIPRPVQGRVHRRRTERERLGDALLDIGLMLLRDARPVVRIEARPGLG